jgi:hypothetical protein
MAQDKQTLGNAIDQVIEALEPLPEPARRTVLMAVCAHLNIEAGNVGHRSPVAEPANTTVRPAAPAAVATTPPRPVLPVDIRSLKEAKKPKNAQQMACLVAYYLQDVAPEAEKKESITANDLEKYFKQANFKLPQRLQQVLPDGKSSGYFDSAGRGAYKLNPVGYNLVVHSLPADGGPAA